MTMLEKGIGTEEPTVTLGGREFRRRRRFARLRRVRPFLYAALLVGLVAGVIWLIFFSSQMAVRGVEISGNNSLSAIRIEGIADAPIGRPLARADLAAIEARVESIPAVESASVTRSWPRTVHIEIVERTPLAVVNRGSGLQAIDADGVLFGRYAAQPAGLPLVRTPANVKAEALAEAAKVVAALRSDIAAKVDYIDLETVDRIRLRLAGGRIVNWGSAENSNQKAEVLAVLLAQKAREIDVSVPGRPTTR